MTGSNTPSHVRDVVDLRSDTVTRPTPEMYEAMVSAPLGDDVLGDDPTVAELEALAAGRTGMAAGLFVPSGTMGNQIALATHCNRGDAILIEQEAHILYYEVGAPAMIAGVVSWTLPSIRGAMDPAVVESRILKRDLHTPGTTLLCLENTHNRAGGAVVPLSHMAAYREITSSNGMKIHLDGARVFNAAAALGVPAIEITRNVDTVSICLSKGLGSPVGSVLCGPLDFIDMARFWRKRLGGGMRQAGILAACGLVSLNTMVDRLVEDHIRAKRLGAAIASLPGLSVNPASIETNMVLVDTDSSAAEIRAKLAEHKVWCLAVGANRLRLVLHSDIDDDKCDRAIQAFRALSAPQSRILSH